MIKKRKKIDTKGIFNTPNLYLTKSKNSKKTKATNTPYKNTTKPLLANIIISIIIISLLIVFSYILSPTATPPKTLKEISISQELSDDFYPLADTFIASQYIEHLISDYVRDLHIAKDSIHFEDFALVDESNTITHHPPVLNHAIPSEQPHTPMIAIIIDDMGFSGYKTYGFIDLPPPLTLSFLPYVGGLKEKYIAALGKGHEVMIHMPMETLNPKINAGPHYLKTSMSPDEIKQEARKAFDKFSYYTGLNNHMGSKFMENEKALDAFMQELKKEKVFFLDSKTSAKSVGQKVANKYKVPFISRDIFLDNVQDKTAILAQLSKLETIALKRGYAIGIGHPYKTTLSVLSEWLPIIKSKGFRIVPVQQIISEINAKQ